MRSVNETQKLVRRGRREGKIGRSSSLGRGMAVEAGKPGSGTVLR
jgi:hypothetical protein